MRIAMGCFVTDRALLWVPVCLQENMRFQKSRSRCTSSADLESTGDRVTAAPDALSLAWGDKPRAGRQIAVWRRSSEAVLAAEEESQRGTACDTLLRRREKHQVTLSAKEECHEIRRGHCAGQQQ